MNDVPCLYLGQNSSQLCNELNKISLYLSNNADMVNNVKSSVIYKGGFYNRKFNNDQILDDLMKVIEKLDTVSCLHYICDLGISNNSDVLQDVADYFPGISLRSLHISSIDKLHGINAINSVINLERSLNLSDAVMLRGFDDIQQLMVVSGGHDSIGTDRHMHNYLSYMAADVFVSFCNKIVSENSCIDKCWPINVCSGNKKIYDVRSSFWRYLRNSNKKNEYNATRAMATNLHSLHTITDLKLNSKCEKYIEAADILNVYYNRNTCFYSNTKPSSTDIKVAMDWATPHVHWPIQGSDNIPKKKNETHISSSSSVISEISRNTIFTASGNPVAKADSTGAATRKEISAVAFESLYATAAISNICKKTKPLLAMGAFKHSFSGYDLDGANDALDYVCDYINFT